LLFEKRFVLSDLAAGPSFIEVVAAGAELVEPDDDTNNV
jgi:hypothetical protein